MHQAFCILLPSKHIFPSQTQLLIQTGTVITTFSTICYAIFLYLTFYLLMSRKNSHLSSRAISATCKTYSTSENETPPISWVLIGRHLIFYWLTSPTCCNSPRKCTPSKYMKRQKAGLPIVTKTPSRIVTLNLLTNSFSMFKFKKSKIRIEAPQSAGGLLEEFLQVEEVEQIFGRREDSRREDSTSF